VKKSKKKDRERKGKNQKQIKRVANEAIEKDSGDRISKTKNKRERKRKTFGIY
jgi:hypothetical protein